MRVGLNTGLVVVGHIGHDLHMEYTAIGDTINLAARMQSVADPNSILIAENTYRLAEQLFDFEDRGQINVKGKAESVQVYRVRRAREGVSRTRGIAGLDSPLVGRARDLQVLQARLEEVRQGRGQIVSVVGEAGLGKSRLIAEVRRGLTIQSDLHWLEGRSLSYESSTPYAPYIDLLSSLFDVRADEDDADKYRKLAARDAERAPFLATLLGIAVAGEDAERLRYLEPPALRERVFQAVLDTCEELTRTRSAVLVFEDLHWIDATSLELLERLLALTDRVPLLILALFRLQRQEPAWHFHEVAARDYAQRYTAIRLEPLTEEQARELVANLLHIEDLPERVRALILRKAEGNPFFVEEVIRSLLDARLVVRENSHWRATREIENIAVPDTLAGVIMARLDKLDDETRQVAQTAAVIGREFRFDVLHDVSDASAGIDQPLVTLQQRELIRETTPSLARAYRFKHALTQETAYGSILFSRRRELHRRVAECLEQITPDRVNDLARHWLEAEDEARALPYLVQSGERAARAYATADALNYFAHAIDLLACVENLELARRAYEGLGGVLVLAGQLPPAWIITIPCSICRSAQRLAMQVSALNRLPPPRCTSVNSI
jgi:predicted ATPase